MSSECPDPLNIRQYLYREVSWHKKNGDNVIYYRLSAPMHVTLCSHNIVFNCANPFNFAHHLVPWLQEYWRIANKANACRRARHDNSAGKERCVLREEKASTVIITWESAYCLTFCAKVRCTTSSYELLPVTNRYSRYIANASPWRVPLCLAWSGKCISFLQITFRILLLLPPHPPTHKKQVQTLQRSNTCARMSVRALYIACSWSYSSQALWQGICTWLRKWMSFLQSWIIILVLDSCITLSLSFDVIFRFDGSKALTYDMRRMVMNDCVPNWLLNKPHNNAQQWIWNAVRPAVANVCLFARHWVVFS